MMWIYEEREESRRTYIVKLPPIVKALLEETNRRYMFYEFITTRTRFLTYALGRRDAKRVYAKVPVWLYEIASSQGLNSVGVYLVSVGWMSFFNAGFDPATPSISVQVYRNFYKAFGDPLFSTRYREKILQLMNNEMYWHPHKVFDSSHRLAKRLRYVKERYRLTRTNTVLLYLAFFLRYIKDTMERR